MSSDDQFDEDVVYQKRDVDEAEIEDVWDDSVLIKMYDEMIDKTYVMNFMDELQDSLGEQYNSGSKKKKATTTDLQWHVGDHCMAPYYEDQLWYPAVIKKIDLAHGKCEVLYDVYDDLARVDIADLTKVTENEQESTSSENVKKKSYKQRPSRAASGQTKKYSKSPSKNDSHIVPPLVPPPPLAFARLKTPNDEEALSSMLMSWYMSGYHTGYYQALRDQDGEKKKISK